MFISHNARAVQAERIVDIARDQITELAKNYIVQFMTKWPFFEEYWSGMGVDGFTIAPEFRERFTGLRAERWGSMDWEALTPRYLDHEELVYPDVDLSDFARDIEKLKQFLNDYEDFILLDKVRCNKRYTGK